MSDPLGINNSDPIVLDSTTTHSGKRGLVKKIKQILQDNTDNFVIKTNVPGAVTLVLKNPDDMSETSKSTLLATAVAALQESLTDNVVTSDDETTITIMPSVKKESEASSDPILMALLKDLKQLLAGYDIVSIKGEVAEAEETSEADDAEQLSDDFVSVNPVKDLLTKIRDQIDTLLA